MRQASKNIYFWTKTLFDWAPVKANLVWRSKGHVMTDVSKTCAQLLSPVDFCCRRKDRFRSFYKYVFIPREKEKHLTSRVSDGDTFTTFNVEHCIAESFEWCHNCVHSTKTSACTHKQPRLVVSHPDLKTSHSFTTWKITYVIFIFSK